MHCARALVEIINQMIELVKTSLQFHNGLDEASKAMLKVADDIEKLILTKTEGTEYAQADEEDDGEKDFWKGIPKFGG